MKVPSIARLVFNKNFFQKIFAWVLLVLIAYALQWFVFLFMVTFIFSYLFLNLWDFLHLQFAKYFVDWIKTKPIKKFFSFLFSTNTIVLGLYIVFLWLLIYAISDLIPKVLQELSDLGKSIPWLDEQIKSIQSRLEEIKNFKQDFKWTLENVLTQSNFDMLLKFVWNVKNVWLVIIEFIIAMILSYVFIIDRKKIKAYLLDMKRWNFAFLYNEYEIVFTKISNWFWLIFKAQSLISFVNTMLTILWLYFIAFIHWATSFPFIFTLAIIVFIFWMIPVLWMFLSWIPMVMIGFSFWWFPVVVEVLLMVVVIHMIEAYYLNPRIVSSYAELPMSLTFLILVVSEHIFWFAWLLIWVPIFYIVVDVLKDFDIYIWKVKKANEGLNYLKSETKESISKDIRLSRSWKKWV